MSDKNTTAQSEGTQAKQVPFTECMEQMTSTCCGPEMKKWMESCASNMSEACSCGCDTQTKSETTEKA